jgi:hypothetical protein
MKEGLIHVSGLFKSRNDVKINLSCKIFREKRIVMLMYQKIQDAPANEIEE